MVRNSTSLGSAPSEQLGQRAAGLPAQYVDLEQAILRLHPALQEERVVFVERKDVRHAVHVAQNPRGTMQPRQSEMSCP